ncbi:uncharacterized protein A4U43_C04F29420 [Asparagus officinalis]|uniref:Uncharacterized protein n=1 Tax=Asparagus officinalis TaxID=4686 RepID=A0A5P1F6B9_ASPOF|nr:uncharacterized protein A4U43_C04F29420 [Asparagus officinalis]
MRKWVSHMWSLSRQHEKLASTMTAGDVGWWGRFLRGPHEIRTWGPSGPTGLVLTWVDRTLSVVVIPEYSLNVDPILASSSWLEIKKEGLMAVNLLDVDKLGLEKIRTYNGSRYCEDLFGNAMLQATGISYTPTTEANLALAIILVFEEQPIERETMAHSEAREETEL